MAQTNDQEDCLKEISGDHTNASATLNNSANSTDGAPTTTLLSKDIDSSGRASIGRIDGWGALRGKAITGSILSIVHDDLDDSKKESSLIDQELPVLDERTRNMPTTADSEKIYESSNEGDDDDCDKRDEEALKDDQPLRTNPADLEPEQTATSSAATNEQAISASSSRGPIHRVMTLDSGELVIELSGEMSRCFRELIADVSPYETSSDGSLNYSSEGDIYDACEYWSDDR